MAALDDDYSPQMSFEDMARLEYERRLREQARYAPPGAPAPMQPSEYVVAQAPVPPPLRVNEMPTGPDPRASITSALDMQEPRASFEMQAQQGAPAPQRYVPQTGAIPPMYPNPPPVATADVPPPLPDATFPGRQPGVSQATQDILAERGQQAPPPSALTPSELAVPPPPGMGMPGRQPGVSQATQDILAERGQPEGQSITPAEPANKGDLIWTAGKGMHRAEGGETGGVNLGGIEFDLEKGLHRRGSAVTVTSGAPTAEPKPVAEAEIPSALTPPVPGRKPEVSPKYESRGAVGHPQPVVGKPVPPPPATPKANIDPQYLVRLEQSNPALHDTIVQAATAAGVGSWDYANLIYGASKGNPNYNEGGRKGLAGITDEDIQKYKSGAYAQVFADADPMNPATNLMMGALKFREMRDLYGSRTPGSLIAYRVGEDRANELSRHTPEQQREHLPPADLNFVRQAIGGPEAKPGTEPQLHASDSGTYQPKQAAQMLIKAAQEGDPRVYYRYQNDTLPRGMTSNDGWRYAETKMVTGFIRAGDMDGAQKAREMLFQMQHVGANQALMRARSYLQAGDMVGAAKEAMLAYWATPDGGQARATITPQGIMMQRYNEATGQPFGAPFKLDEQRIMGLMQITQDAGAYQKNVEASRKLNAEIEHKQAETGKLKAETGYIEQRPELERYRSDTAAETKLLDIQRKLLANPKDAETQAALEKHLDAEIPRYFPEKDISGAPVLPTPEVDKQRQIWRELARVNRTLDLQRAASISRDLTSGKLSVAAHPSGGGVVLNKPAAEGGTPIGILLTPTTMALLRRQPTAAPAASPIGGAARPAAR